MAAWVKVKETFESKELTRIPIASSETFSKAYTLLLIEERIWHRFYFHLEAIPSKNLPDIFITQMPEVIFENDNNCITYIEVFSFIICRFLRRNEREVLSPVHSCIFSRISKQYTVAFLTRICLMAGGHSGNLVSKNMLRFADALDVTMEQTREE